mgnify:CR=1 FL=1
MDVIDAMEMINDDETYYYNTQNEEIVYELMITISIFHFLQNIK